MSTESQGPYICKRCSETSLHTQLQPTQTSTCPTYLLTALSYSFLFGDVFSIGIITAWHKFLVRFSIVGGIELLRLCAVIRSDTASVYIVSIHYSRISHTIRWRTWMTATWLSRTHRKREKDQPLCKVLSLPYAPRVKFKLLELMRLDWITYFICSLFNSFGVYTAERQCSGNVDQFCEWREQPLQQLQSLVLPRPLTVPPQAVEPLTCPFR